MKRAYPVLLGTVVAFLGLHALLFHYGAYAYWVSPDSSTGYLETILYHERIRPKNGPNQVLGVGDSRMALMTKFANSFTPESGYSYGTIAVAGTTPRVWSYMLRDADPSASAYRAIIFGLDNYNDEDTLEDVADRESDLNYLANRLRVGDLNEFAFSYHDPQRQWRAASGILFRGLVYKRDLEDLLHTPIRRFRLVRQSWRDSFSWFYDYQDTSKNLVGLEVDWEHRRVTMPPGLAPDLEVGIRRRLVEPIAPQTGLHGTYMHTWMGRIAARYRESQTKLIFLRLPRAAWIRPDLPPANPKSSVRELAQQQKNVILLPEHLFDDLERPEFFKDEYHMTQAGLDRFTEILVRQVREILGPAH
ncbi:MAG: hypothetical protein RL328_1503 [Acidobacteriota bacterium]|jgi:hypothetical protein